MLRRIIKYMLSSGITVLVDFGIFTAAKFFGAGIGLATALGRAVAAIVNFTVNRNAVFKAEGNAVIQFLKYITLVAVSGTISAYSVEFLQNYIPGGAVAAKGVVETGLFVFNYVIQRVFIFRAPKNPSADGAEGGTV